MRLRNAYLLQPTGHAAETNCRQSREDGRNSSQRKMYKKYLITSVTYRGAPSYSDNECSTKSGDRSFLHLLGEVGRPQASSFWRRLGMEVAVCRPQTRKQNGAMSGTPERAQEEEEARTRAIKIAHNRELKAVLIWRWHRPALISPN